MRRALVGVALVGLLCGCGTEPRSEPPRAQGSAVAPGTQGSAAAPREQGGPAVVQRHAAADVAFLKALIPHHRDGIALASAAAARSPQARTLAQAIIVTQQDEVVRMSGWLRAWGEAPPPSAAPAAVTGDPVRALVAHQDAAIRLAQREQSDGQNPQALAFAKQLIESRAGQIEELESLLR